MPVTRSPTARRRELGAVLRALRTQQGMTVEQVAERLLVSPSKISRLETGQRGASQRDIRDLCDLYEVPVSERQPLADLAAEGKQRAWWQPYDLPYSTYVGLEAEATSIRDFALGIVPGLLQTEDYARAVSTAVLSAAEPGLPGEVIEQRVHARLERQERLLSSGRQAFSALLDECVLHRVVGDRAVMREQLQQLLQLSSLPAVDVRVVPFAAGALPTINNKFIILDFESTAMSSVVYLESLSGELILERESDVAAYKRAYDTLVKAAASAGESRARISELIAHYGK